MYSASTCVGFRSVVRTIGVFIDLDVRRSRVGVILDLDVRLTLDVLATHGRFGIILDLDLCLSCGLLSASIIRIVVLTRATSMVLLGSLVR
jgi:hypothetical protein